MKVNVNTNNFYLKRVNQNKIILQTEDNEHHRIITKILEDNEINFYTYTIKEDKPRPWLLKGLNLSYSEEEILEELQALAPSSIRFLKVTKFQKANSKAKGISLPFFLIHLSPDSIAADLKVIKAIFYQLIKWEKLINENFCQCKRCQRFGHAANNCRLPYCCVKCSESHEPGGCSLLNRNKENVFCINCKQHEHSASYKACPKLKEFNNFLLNKNNKNIKLEKIKNSVNNLVHDNKSFAEVADVKKIDTLSQYVNIQNRKTSSEFSNYNSDLSQSLTNKHPRSFQSNDRLFQRKY